MSRPASRLPARPSLEQLQRQAKELLRQHHAGLTTALERFQAVSPRFNQSDRTPCLADAQFVLAREYGLEDWARLREQVGIMRAFGPLFISAKPPFYTIDWAEDLISVHGQQSPDDWDEVYRVIKQYKISKMVADAMNDTALARLSHLNGMTHLHIAGSSDVTNTGLKHLARMPQLQSLQLGGGSSPITDAGLDFLPHLHDLRRFQACWTPRISDAGLSGLSRCELIEDVNLLGTPTGDGAIRTLVAKPHLRRFQSGRLVTDSGLALLHQFPVFKTWHGGDIRYGLMSPDAGPNFLLIDGPFTNAGIARLAGLDGLFALSFFWHTPSFTAAGLAPLKDLPNLGFLGCRNDRCDDEAMRHIAACPTLRMLMGQGATAGDAGFEALSQSKTLEYLWGRECPNLTGRGFASLAVMPSLKGLAISCKNVDDTSLSSLEHFPALREFMPMDFSDAGFRHIGRCKSLEALWCMYCRDTGDTATDHLSGLPGLKTYYAGKTGITDRSLEILGQIVSLERLEFWQCAELTDPGLIHLTALPNLKEISVIGLPNVTRQAAADFPTGVRVKYRE